MKKLFLFIFAAFLVFNLYSQEWTKLLPEKEKRDINFFDYQNAFNSYWKDKNVVNGKYTDASGNIQKAYGWKQFKRWEYFWVERIDPITGKFPDEEIRRAYLEYQKDRTQTKDEYSWSSLGPDNSEGGYAGIGRINVIAFHPSDVNTFWIGAPSGGLWVTSTGGNSWTPLTENLDVQGISAIAIPSDFASSSTIYIGTGDRDAFDNYSNGVLKSTDGGNTWNTTGLVFTLAHGHSVNKLLIHPADNSIIYAATTNGLYISINAGDQWTMESSTEYVDIEFHPTDPTILYGSTRNGKVYKNNSLIFSAVNNSRIELAVSVNAPERLYILASNSSNGLEGIYRSDNSGTTVSLIFDGKALLNWSTDGSGSNDGQAWYDLALASDPNNADILYCGGVNTWKSTDGGYTWQLNNHWYGGGGVPAVHADKHYLQFRPGTSTLYECNDGGIYLTTNGSTWTDLSNTLFISQIYKMSTAQTVPDVTITGLQDNGTKMKEAGNWYDVIGGDGMGCIVDPTDEYTQYGSLYYGEIYRTDNMWNSSTEISQNIPGGPAGAWVTPYVLDPNNHNTIYVGYNDIWKSTDKGETFESIGSFGTLNSMAVSDANSSYICVATYTNIFLTKNGGNTWNNVTGNLPTNAASITDICFSHENPETIWVTFGGYNQHGIYQTDNGGDTWINISQGLPEIPVKSIIQNKLEAGFASLYVGTDFGVYNKNGVDDWILYGTSMPLVVVNDLDIYYDNINPLNSKLRAATYGRGLWEIDLEMSGNFVPNTSSTSITNITSTTATATGNILNDFGNTVSQSGFVVSTSPNPNLSQPDVIIFYTDPIVTNGSFSIELSGLESGTKYYCKAFATNTNGTGYGNELSLITLCSTLTSIPYQIGFEDGDEIPVCWSEQYIQGNNINWFFGDNANYNPYSGDKFAYFMDITTNDDKTMLVSPTFDLSAYSNLEFSFWHIQIPTFSFQDELKIFYKNQISGDWLQLAHYNQAVNSWTKRTIELPNLTPNYQIAIEGNAKSGKGVGIDEAAIELSSSIFNNASENIAVYPNPSKGIFQIRGLENFPFFIEISDYTGKIVLSDFIYENVINLSSLNKGIYIIKIKQNQQLTINKLIIN